MLPTWRKGCDLEGSKEGTAMSVGGSSVKRVRTTVRLPRGLYDEARKFVDHDLVQAENINDFFVAAICAYVKLLHRKQVDASFAKMAEDFSQSDWEAFEIMEREPVEA
jgi:hypothetical protein